MIDSPHPDDTVPHPPAVTPVTPPAPRPPASASIARAATLIGLGSVASRVFGMLREMTLTHYFGASGLVSAYTVASFVPQMLYDMVIGGMISSALVPVFSEYAERGREELGRLASVILTLAVLGLVLVAALLMGGASQVATLIGGDLDPQFLAVAIHLLRVIAPATIFLGLSGITTALLYATQRFTLPAFVITVFNAALVATIIIGGGGTITLAAVGFLVGSVLQVVLQAPGLRDLPFRWSLDLRHPALRRITLLYLPMLLGIAIAQVGAIIDRRLASGVSEHAIAWMRYATTLQQFPQGLVTTAVSMAALPALARQAGDLPAFRVTLGSALRVVLFLTLPLCVALFLLAEPSVALLFERGRFTAFDTQQTALALRLYLIGLPFAALDLPLVYAFYARGDTLTPNLVALVGVAAYLVVALPLVEPLGFLGLVAANAAQLAAHALVMFYLAHRRFDGVRRQAIGRTLLKTGGACLGLLAVILGVEAGLGRLGLHGALGALVHLVLAGGLGLAVFGLLAAWLRLAEAQTVARVVTHRIGKRFA
ncbi:MAG: murein biosynthesis integral membrane protein MurJ [Anaerolineae bacterium]|nr:murein biosynthesis integral membrane protein MurJ [Anaerolineae bacterium]